MAGKAAAPGTAVLLVTANVGSLFDDPENLQKNWLREFYQVVHTHRPHFMALHCQEFGGKNYEASMAHVDKFVKELLSSEAMKEFNRARVYLDENYRSQEQFTALGSFYFLHESLKNIYQFDFRAKKYKKVTGKEIYSDTLESTPMLEKEKFPQDYFPECKWSRKGFVRTRWSVGDCAFDLVNIHLFHDASNLVAWETSPSVYAGIRHKALGYVLDRSAARASLGPLTEPGAEMDPRAVVSVTAGGSSVGCGPKRPCLRGRLKATLGSRRPPAAPRSHEPCRPHKAGCGSVRAGHPVVRAANLLAATSRLHSAPLAGSTMPHWPSEWTPPPTVSQSRFGSCRAHCLWAWTREARASWPEPASPGLIPTPSPRGHAAPACGV
uniref:inositol-polyphosphate 5-phosphatase n=1 Tax=Rousettus aegyptiacus TaxID=9407 RepID=A0A7J8G978_ROUAE|nr:inositol polyphosphate-5-phosphatase A [Rousettus aegyptiacus]